MSTFNELAEYLQQVLPPEEHQAVRVAELLEQHMKELIEQHRNEYEHPPSYRY